MIKIFKSYTNVYKYYSRNYLSDRDTKILEVCKWKNVLHIWAWDAPYTEEKYNKGTLLHKLICDVSKNAVWLELDTNSIDFLKEKWIDNILNIDLNNLKKFDFWFNIDVIVFWETIEHIMNLKTFFDSIKNIMDENTILLISTPNSSYIVHSLLWILWIELVHYDHNLLFSYWTLKQLIEKNGLVVKENYFTFISRENNSLIIKLIHSLSKIISFIFPWWWETLLLLCVKK